MAEPLTTIEELKTGLTEASDVVALPEQRFLVVSDVVAEAVIVGRDGQRVTLPLSNLPDPAGLEAVAYDGSFLYVLVEEENRLIHYRWTVGDAAARYEREQTIVFPPKMADDAEENDGIEGMLRFGAGDSPIGQAGFLLAKEKQPKHLFYLRDDSTKLQKVKLDPALAALEDFAGLAFDTKRGTVLLVSEKSSQLAEVMLASDEDGKLVVQTQGVYDLVDDGGKMKRVEGVAADDDGGWWVLLEDSGLLRRVR